MNDLIISKLDEITCLIDKDDDLIELNFNLHDFVSFADYFFDGFFSDLIIQNRINEANKKVNSVIMNVESIRNQLIRVLNSFK